MSTSSAATRDHLIPPEKSRYVPPELLKEIFSHCDAPTLAAVSRVSSACLELTAKLLYTNITLSDAKSMAMLLRLKSMAGTPPPLSDRVTAHTSRSLIHSVTLYDGGDLVSHTLGAYKPFPPALQISVLAISVPTRNVRQKGGDTLPAFYLHPAMDLFNPRILLLRGRRALLPAPLPDDYRLIYLQGLLANRSALSWTRLALIIQSGASIATSDFHGLQECVPRHTGLPLKLVWDFLDIETGSERLSATTTACRLIDVSCAETSRTQCHVRAWVASEDIKDGALAAESAFLPASEARKFREAALEVPSDRARLLRDAFVEHGVRKDM